MVTVAERLALALSNVASEVFGVMGNGNALLIDALLRRTGIVYTPVRHEAATVASADAYFRARRRLAIATTTYGAGFTNTLTALAEAVRARTPLLLVTGSAPTSGARPWDVDQRILARACGAPTVTVTPDAPAAAVLEAYRIAMVDRLPVVLELPYDLPQQATDEPQTDSVLTADAVLEAAPATRKNDPRLASEIAPLAAILRSASRPVVLAGRGAFEARRELAALADTLGALTVTTAPARGMFVGRELDAGICGGFSSPRTAQYLASADAVLVVGAGLNAFTMGFGRLFSPDAAILQLDYADSATHPAVTHFVSTDAASGVAALQRSVDRLPEHPNPVWPGLDRHEVASAQFDRGRAPEFAPNGALDPRGLMRALDTAIPEDRVIAQDGGHFIGWANTHLHLPGPDSMLLVGTALQSIGLGFACAPGAARAAGSDRMLVLVTGDGGGLMALPDLESTVAAAQRATIVVINDSAYTAEVTQYGSLGLDERPMRIPEVDFARIAEGVGARATVVRRVADLAAYAEWARSGVEGTWLLDCRVSGEIIAPYQEEIMANIRASLRPGSPVSEAPGQEPGAQR